MAKRKNRSGECDSCGNHVPNLCAVSTVIQLCQQDAKALMIEGAYLEFKVIVRTPSVRAPAGEGT